MPASVTSEILKKLRRAYRNDAGTHFTAEELRHLARLGAVHLLAKAEADEIVAELGGADARSVDEVHMPTAYTVSTLAQRWDCSEGLIRKLIVADKINHFRWGKLIRIPKDAVLAFERSDERA